MIKVDETHDHAVYEKIKALHYFMFAAEEIIFFLLIASYVAIWYKLYSCNKILQCTKRPLYFCNYCDE